MGVFLFVWMDFLYIPNRIRNDERVLKEPSTEKNFGHGSGFVRWASFTSLAFRAAIGGKIVPKCISAPLPPTELAPYACVSWMSSTSHVSSRNGLKIFWALTKSQLEFIICLLKMKVCEIVVHQMRIFQNKTMTDRRKYQFDIIWMHTLNIRRCLNSFQFRVQTLADYPSN